MRQACCTSLRASLPITMCTGVNTMTKSCHLFAVRGTSQTSFTSSQSLIILSNHNIEHNVFFLYIYVFSIIQEETNLTTLALKRQCCKR